jgi:protein Tex
VDIGIHQDGLVHVSELADRFVKDPNDVVKVGQIVKVTVLGADAKAKRVALSMKSGKGGGEPAPKPPAPARQEPKMEDRIASLAEKWRKR